MEITREEAEALTKIDNFAWICVLPFMTEADYQRIKATYLYYRDHNPHYKAVLLLPPLTRGAIVAFIRSDFDTAEEGRAGQKYNEICKLRDTLNCGGHDAIEMAVAEMVLDKLGIARR
jgi:hypothetical protein